MVNLPAHLDPNSSISKERSVYFDFDDFSIKPDYAALVERGSAEYNLALGQKRAEAVVKGLKIYGATDRQLEAVSWGEERPVATGHDEAAWAKNRRADIVYPKQ